MYIVDSIKNHNMFVFHESLGWSKLRSYIPAFVKKTLINFAYACAGEIADRNAVFRLTMFC